METIIITEMVAVVLAAVAFVLAMYYSEAFRTMVFAYVKKQWRENRAWIQAVIDERMAEIANEMDAEISAKTDMYIRQEILRRSIHNALDRNASHSVDWAVHEYKQILSELLNDKE